MVDTSVQPLASQPRVTARVCSAYGPVDARWWVFPSRLVRISRPGIGLLMAPKGYPVGTSAVMPRGW